MLDLPMGGGVESHLATLIVLILHPIVVNTGRVRMMRAEKQVNYFIKLAC
ncbi:MAG: hypothetical protein ACOX7C_07530 [Brevefilum sp.]|jgi:hypothetical protein